MERILGNFPLDKIIALLPQMVYWPVSRYPLTSIAFCLVAVLFVMTRHRSHDADIRGTVIASLSFDEYRDVWIHLQVHVQNLGNTEITPSELVFILVPYHGDSITTRYDFSKGVRRPLGPDGQLHDTIGGPYYDANERPAVCDVPKRLDAFFVDSSSVHHKLQCSRKDKRSWYPTWSAGRGTNLQ